MDNEKKWWDDLRFEFNLYINDNIICQRMFNVKGYNKKVLKSLELKDMMNEITGINLNDAGRMGIIPTYFKKLCNTKSWKEYKPYNLKESEGYVGNLENNDVFTFEVRVDKKMVAKSSFNGNQFQTDVIYAVDIRELVPEIISELEYYMSMEEYTLPSEEFSNNY